MKKKSDNKKNSGNKIAHIPICRKCGIPLTDENWYPSYKRKCDYVCKKCKYEHAKEWNQNNKDRMNQLKKVWRQNNRDKVNQSQRESHRQLNDEVIDAYGGKCACCGETRKEFLSIDHIDGNGNKQKKEIGVRTSQEFYCWLKQNNYPEGFQVLCFNCNCGKRNFSVCPHIKEDFEKEFEAKHETASRKSEWKLRLNVIKGYGGKCELCGEDNPHFLTIDHIDGGGRKEKKMLGGTYSLYRKLRDENYPKDNYRLLCYNCNCALGFNRITEEEMLQQNVLKEKGSN